MAKFCPETNKKVLYLKCLECERHGKCSKKENNDNTKEKRGTYEKEDI